MNTFKKLNINKDSELTSDKKVIVYGYFDLEKDLISTFINDQNSDIIHINKSLIKDTISDILNSPTSDDESYDFNDLDSKLPKIKFMLLKGFSQKNIHTFMEDLKKMQLERPIVAALTNHNKDWIFENLITEVYAEHLEMTKRR